jgi:hypothetical protein
MLVSRIVAALPWANSASWSGLLVSTSREAGVEYVFWKVFHVARPCCAADEASAPDQVPPLSVASWPPASQTNWSAPYQYSPGK